jgi:hypothetical protein
MFLDFYNLPIYFLVMGINLGIYLKSVKSFRTAPMPTAAAMHCLCTTLPIIGS